MSGVRGEEGGSNMRRPPDLSGHAGRAWRVPNRSRTPDHAATLGQWLVQVPGAHPFWEHWAVAVIHLRPLPGAKAAHKRYPQAEYEFVIFAIDPTTAPEPDPDKADEGYPFLTPVDVAEQFHGVSDRDAVRICDAAVRAILSGDVSPDQDFRPMWKALIRDTVAHFASGAHAEN